VDLIGGVNKYSKLSRTEVNLLQIARAIDSVSAQASYCANHLAQG